MTTKAIATSTKPDTTTTKPADPPKPGNGNGTTAATAPAEPGDPEADEGGVTPQIGKRPLTVMISDRSYRNLRVLAATEGSNVSAVVVEAVEASITAKLRAALAAMARDLG